MSDHYDFNKKFRLRILSLLLDPRWISIYGTVIVRPEYFEEEKEQELATAILDYFHQYNRPPDEVDLIAMMGDDFKDIIYDIFEEADDVINEDYPTDVVIQFAKEQAAKIAVLDSVDDINRGDLSKMRGRIEEAMRVGESLLSPGIDIVSDIDKWLYELWTDKVRTGWMHIDKILEGGLSIGELGVILAPTNRGKSMGLVNLGHAAAFRGSGKNVVHFSHEMEKEKVAKRYAARLLHEFPKRGTNIEKYEKRFLEQAKKMMKGRIRIIGGAKKMSVTEVRAHVKRLISEGFNPGLIIDDYPDLLVPTRRWEQKRYELADIYYELRAMSGEFGVPIWGASQANRAALSQEVVSLDNIAEAIDKANIADVVIALCQTQDESFLDQCRLYMAKVRDSKAHTMFDAKFYGDSQAIITTGITKRKDKDDA